MPAPERMGFEGAGVRMPLFMLQVSLLFVRGDVRSVLSFLKLIWIVIAEVCSGLRCPNG